MEPAVISALSAVLGSIVGGSASIATAWFTQNTQGRREMIRAEVDKREALYADFIGECSRLVLDALGHSLEKAEILTKVYALENRIRLSSSDAVVNAAQHAIKRILDLYFERNYGKEDLRNLKRSMEDEPLGEFSEGCRRELASLQRSA
jgi:hypothetical protein